MNRIRELRQSKNWRQSDLAERLNTKPQTISHYELGDRGLDVETINKCCEIFDCTADYLLGRSPLRSTELSKEEAAMVLAYRRADDRARDMVALALEPFQEKSYAKKAT